MNRDRWSFVWPAAGIAGAVAVLVFIRPSRVDHISLGAGVAAWGGELAILAALAAHPTGARLGVVAAGLLLPLPAFVTASPLARLLLACVLGATFVRAADLAPRPTAGNLARLAALCTLFDPGRVGRRARHCDAAAVGTLVVATAILTAAFAAVGSVPAAGSWLPVRWLAGGVAVLALAEVASACHRLLTAALGLDVPPFFRSPYRATSVGEFWTRRWNLPASAALREHCFAPVARRGPALGLLAAFAASAAGHALLAGLALGRRVPALSCAAFFLLQPLAIVAERRLGVRRWPAAAGRGWTLTFLAATSPLVVEPLLEILETFVGAPDDVLIPTAGAVAFCVAVSGVNALAALPFRPVAANASSPAGRR
jgi:hypothetical protein